MPCGRSGTRGSRKIGESVRQETGGARRETVRTAEEAGGGPRPAYGATAVIVQKVGAATTGTAGSVAQAGWGTAEA